MILKFNDERFKERILGGLKIHTLRTDRTERWKKGQKIHFWLGDPKDMKVTPKPHQFHEANCSSVQKVEITFSDSEQFPMSVIVDNVYLNGAEMEELALSDGFDDLGHMAEWFMDYTPKGFKGRLIHWTKKKY